MRSTLRHAVLALTAASIAALGALSVPAASAAARASHTEYGPPVRLGAGTARTYLVSEGSTPLEIGVVVDAAATESLPASPPTDGHHCYDVNGDGRINPVTECAGGYYLPLHLPSDAPAPYRWVLLNWNPSGHGPVGMYDTPHFDMHFYVVPRSAVDAIGYGTCGQLVACDQVPEVAAPLPAKYVPSGYPPALKQTVEVAMGDHLDNDAGFKNGATFVYGSLDGRIAFLEPMIQRDALRQTPAGGPRQCQPVAQPAAWQRSGWYPTSYCLGQTADGGYQVSLDGLVRRHRS
ncbi:conserved hypothetical protein [Catenulispora acidiphila DSM 44928]|uniref:DUF5602 domain-containing protein n=1 Tax=Catenulispora acidiphila (strain DSM 44928 / JCM 14897 / NBRC 102108 / NRRL B-24433 / ID139908) TaxID=479433 RepID=C7PZ67_CATAD|nr:hypothetical protein [Catenulispora acidiphila]ACU69623.1 conserved hypothetical protein [Catenulispora acidiphila DSM 44928]